MIIDNIFNFINNTWFNYTIQEPRNNLVGTYIKFKYTYYLIMIYKKEKKCYLCRSNKNN